MGEAPAAGQNKQGLVLKNMLFLVGAQVVGTPLSILVNATMGRYLGAIPLGQAYLASTLTQFAFIFVEWGQSGLIPAHVARDRSSAGELLGTALAWRLGMAALVYLPMALGCLALGYEHAFQLILLLVTLQWLFGALSTACQDTVRGFERTDVGALGQVGQQLLNALCVIPTVVLGGGLAAALAAQLVGPAVVLIGTARMLRSVGVGALRVRAATIKLLFTHGAPFLFFGLAMVLQPNVDAVLLSKLGSAESIGWHAVARRLIGTLVLPAAALIAALYPTLARLHKEDTEGFCATTRSALRGTTILAIPIALSCAWYREVGIMIFSKQAFVQAEGNLLILSGFLFLLYFSMPLGSALMAAGRHKQWAATQFLCVGVSAVLDPLLIPWFQLRYGNGGLGVCVANVISEIGMVVTGVAMTPKGIFDRTFALGLARTLPAGLAMSGVAWLLSSLTPFIAAPIALATYFGCLWAVGGVDEQQVAAVKQLIARKMAKK